MVLDCRVFFDAARVLDVLPLDVARLDVPLDARLLEAREAALRMASSVLRRFRAALSSFMRVLLLRADDSFLDGDCDEETGRLDAPRLELRSVLCELRSLAPGRRGFFSFVIISRYHSRARKTHTTLGRGRLVRCLSR